MHPREGEARLGPLSVSTIHVGCADVAGIDPLPAAKPLVDVIEKPDEIHGMNGENQNNMTNYMEEKPKKPDKMHGMDRKYQRNLTKYKVWIGITCAGAETKIH